MRKLRLALALLLGFALVAMTPGSAQSQPRRGNEVRGEVYMTMHTHSADDPDWPELLFPSDRLSFNFSRGEEFSYSSRLCSGQAPFNDLGLDFWPDYPGVDDDGDSRAAVRHRMQGVITRVAGNEGRLRGRTTTVLCTIRNGIQVETNHVIVTHYRANFVRVSGNEVRVSGEFRISPSESTGTFEGLRGHGSIDGALLCLAHQRDRSQPNCAARGHFTDFVGGRGDLTRRPGEIFPGVIGYFRDRTVRTG